MDNIVLIVISYINVFKNYIIYQISWWYLPPSTLEKPRFFC